MSSASAAAAARRGGNGGAVAGTDSGAASGGWLHAAWLALTGAATPAELLTAEVAGGVGGGGSPLLPALTVRSNSRYERVSTEESDDGDGDDGASRESSEPAPETELFLPRGVNLSICCDELRMSKPESWRGWPAKKNSGGGPESMAVDESEPFLRRRRCTKRTTNDVEMEDHPFIFDRQGRKEMLSSS